MRRMQEERTPFVNQQDAAPQGAPSAQIQGTQQPYQLENIQPYVYDGPLELQDSGRPVAQEVDGYTAAVSEVREGDCERGTDSVAAYI